VASLDPDPGLRRLFRSVHSRRARRSPARAGRPLTPAMRRTWGRNAGSARSHRGRVVRHVDTRLQLAPGAELGLAGPRTFRAALREGARDRELTRVTKPAL
jgi:hypothetical protein